MKFDLKGQELACKPFSTFLFPKHLIIAALQQYYEAQGSGEVPRVRLGTGGVSARQQLDGEFGSTEVSVGAHWNGDLTVCSKPSYC